MIKFLHDGSTYVVRPRGFGRYTVARGREVVRSLAWACALGTVTVRRQIAELVVRAKTTTESIDSLLDADRLSAVLEEAFERGDIFFEKVDELTSGMLKPGKIEIEEKEPAKEPDQVLGTLEVIVVDEVGDPISGAEIEFERSGKKETKTTDGSGKAKITDVKESFATVRFKDEKPVRSELRTRWEKPRDKPWLDTATLPSFDEIQVLRAEEFMTTSVFVNEPHTIVLMPKVIKAIMNGMWFETSKSFLLPTAVEGARFTVQLAKENPETDLLVVGHTDSKGDPGYNDPLSLERAKATVAYLKNDVEAWYAWYGSDKAAEKRWGAREDEYMIEGIAAENGEVIPVGKSPVRWYQETRGLAVDGVAGSDTRHALIDEYMQLTDTTLPEDVEPVAHGCGENFPVDPTATGDNTEDQDNRSVEMFLFENPIAPPDKPAAILPVPPGENSQPGSKEYPEWLLRAKETVEHAIGKKDKEDKNCHIFYALQSLVDDSPAKDVPYVVTIDGHEVVGVTDGGGIFHVDRLKAGDYQLKLHPGEAHEKVLFVNAFIRTEPERPLADVADSH